MKDLEHNVLKLAVRWYKSWKTANSVPEIDDGLPEEAALYDAVETMLKAGGVEKYSGDSKTFEQVWDLKKAEGYQYGEDALEQVRFGWELYAQYARGDDKEVRNLPPPADDAPVTVPSGKKFVRLKLSQVRNALIHLGLTLANGKDRALMDLGTAVLSMQVPERQGGGFYFDQIAQRRLWDLCEEVRKR